MRARGLEETVWSSKSVPLLRLRGTSDGCFTTLGLSLTSLKGGGWLFALGLLKDACRGQGSVHPVAFAWAQV